MRPIEIILVTNKRGKVSPSEAPVSLVSNARGCFVSRSRLNVSTIFRLNTASQLGVFNVEARETRAS